MITYLLGALGGLTAIFGVFFGFDLKKYNETTKKLLITGLIGGTTNFFDALGIGSFAPTTALLKGFKQINDRVLPGTLNVSCTIPVVAEAFIFITVIKVETVTLVSMLAAATIGAYLGAGFVSKMDEKKIQMIMGIALLVTAGLMFAGQMKWMPGGGEAIGLTGGKLIIGIVGNFILGALMTAGIGLYAPCMALVYMLGMSADVAFPIMMGSCAFLMPVASIKFVKEGAYDRSAALGITLFGVVGAVVAAKIVGSLPLTTLMWLVIVVVTFTGINMLRSGLKNNQSDEIAA